MTVRRVATGHTPTYPDAGERPDAQVKAAVVDCANALPEVLLLKAGDTVVQNGTRHAWRNETSAPCRMAFFLAGARRH